MNNPLGTNWKTTLGAVLAAAFFAANYFGVEIPGVPHMVMDNGSLFALIGGLLFSKDKDVTGGTRQQ